MGKGRTIAGLILENWRCGRKRHLWVSIASDLKIDAARGDCRSIRMGTRLCIVDAIMLLLCRVIWTRGLSCSRLHQLWLGRGCRLHQPVCCKVAH